MSLSKIQRKLRDIHISMKDLLNQGKFEDSLVAAQKMLKEAKAEKDQKYIGIGNYLVGASFYELQQYSLSISALKRSLEHFEQSKDDKLFYDASMMYGTCLIQIGEFPSAQKEYERALNIAIKRKDVDLEIRTRNNIANIFSEVGDPKSAVEQFEKCRNLAEEHNRPDLLATILGNLAGNIGDLGKFDDSIEILQQAIKLFKKNDDLHGEGRTLDMLSRMYLAKEDYKQAYLNNIKATELFKKINSPDGVAFTTSALSHIYEDEGKITEAIETCKLAMKLAQENEFKLLEVRCAKTLSILYEKNGDYRDAMEHLKNHVQMNQEILNEQTNQQIHQKQTMIEQLYVELETKRKERENVELKKEIEHRNRELTTKAMHLLDKQETLSEIFHDVEKLNQSDFDSQKKQLQKLWNKLNSLITSRDEWDEFELWFNEVHGRFYRALQENYPELTQREQKVCAFLKLKMQTKDIANLTHLAPKTIEVYRTRIRGKMGLKRSQNLADFLQAI